MSFESSKLYSVRRIVAGFGKVPFVSIYCAVMGGFFSIVLPFSFLIWLVKCQQCFVDTFLWKCHCFVANSTIFSWMCSMLTFSTKMRDNNKYTNDTVLLIMMSLAIVIIIIITIAFPLKKQILCQENTLQNTRNTETLFTFSSDNKNFKISKTHQFMHRKISTFSLFYLFFLNNLEELLSSLIYSRFDLICCA